MKQIKVTVEVTEFSGGKERKRMFAKVKNCLDKMSSLPLPSHYAQLVYVGSRPKPNNCCSEPPPNEFDVEHTPNLKLWLTKRNLTCGFFGSLILGLAPPKPPVALESRKMSLKEDEPPSDVLQGPPNVPKVKVIFITLGGYIFLSQMVSVGNDRGWFPHVIKYFM